MEDETKDTNESNTDWEKAYKSLQANSQKAAEKKDAQIEALKQENAGLKTTGKDLEKAVSEKDGRIASLEGDIQTKTAELTSQLESKDATLAELQQKVGQSEKALTRSQLIMKYPNLAELETDGLLPPDSDDLEDKLKKLSEKLSTTADQREVDKRQGAKPEGSEGEGGSASATADEDPYAIQRQLAELGPNDPKFAALEAKYDALTADK